MNYDLANKRMNTTTTYGSNGNKKEPRKFSVKDMILLIIFFIVIIIGSMFYKNWERDPSSPKNYNQSNDYKRDVVQAKKDSDEFELIRQKIEARRLAQEAKDKAEIEARNQKSKGKNITNPTGNNSQITGVNTTPDGTEKISKVKLSTRQPVIVEGDGSNAQTDGQIPVQPQPTQPKKVQKMVKYNDWVDETPEVKDTMERTQEKVIQDENLLKKDLIENSDQKQF